MTRPPDMNWTRHDLELYADDAHDAATSERLSEALRENPELRRRLASVSRVDSLARAALLRPAPASMSPRPTRSVLVGIASVTVLLLGTIVLWRAIERQRYAPTPSDERPVATSPRAADSMIVFSFPMQTKPPAEPQPDKTSEPTASESLAAHPPQGNAPTAEEGAQKARLGAADFGARLDAALARGDAQAAAELLATANAEHRVQGYRRLGAVLRSVTTARRVLGELPVGEQLAACRELALEPRWRTVTCAQLSSLREDPGTRDAVDALLAELALSPDLAPMVERVKLSRPAAKSPVTDRSI